MLVHTKKGTAETFRKLPFQAKINEKGHVNLCKDANVGSYSIVSVWI